jgi:hypothetical protein
MTLYVVTSVEYSSGMSFQILTYTDKTVVYNSNSKGEPCVVGNYVYDPLTCMSFKDSSAPFGIVWLGRQLCTFLAALPSYATTPEAKHPYM